MSESEQENEQDAKSPVESALGSAMESGAFFIADLFGGRKAQPNAALEALAGAGYVGAVIHYAGGGDSGGTERAIFYRPDGTEQEIDAWPNMSYDPQTRSYTHPDDEVRRNWELLNKLERPMYDKHGSWADGGGYHASGVIVYDVANWQAVMREEEEITEHQSSEVDLLDEYAEAL